MIGPADVPLGNMLNNPVFMEMRLPRVLLGYATGATLSVCGAVFQVLLKNSLASPDVMGVSSGAALGAVCAIRFGIQIPLGAGAFLGSALAIGLIQAAGAATQRRNPSGEGLMLAGVAASFLFGSLNMIIQYSGGYSDSFRMMRWASGGIQIIGWDPLLPALITLGGTLLVCRFFLQDLKLIRCGTLLAQSRGVPVQSVRLILFSLISLAVASSVSICGPIGFVGLFGPHMARMTGARGEGEVLFASTMIGGSMLTLCDVAARTLWAPSEIPVGIITSGVGALFFLWLLLRRS
ncbi:LOW QUALITY PROTEIN: ABC-type Fe3+-siderophore transport system, permease component [Thermanaerovibrio velox DSM 12556]|uniref:ABC-type Fe3+-siderophore transport system, permease component n=1 Tax=Thermanaerovibrio velox DSM 12556 TaxID=926567 RepID=H0UNT7_9BACT|nr:LOW QUALITY PROTEIN: ABC-type Fe3+-siderophore transport system, permease component [Thermanaerovibrio velox DSM 12556]